jgi:biotin operon repressor
MTLAVFNKVTGEILDAELIIKKIGGSFMKLWQKTSFDDKYDNLQGFSSKLLLHLITITGYNNAIPSGKSLAKRYKKTEPAISRAITELSKEGYLVKIDGRYYLNPYFCWKGSKTEYEKMCEKISKGGE